MSVCMMLSAAIHLTTIQTDAVFDSDDNIQEPQISDRQLKQANSLSNITAVWYEEPLSDPHVASDQNLKNFILIEFSTCKKK